MLGSVVWLAVAAAQRPSPLSPPTIRADAPWLLGPLSGLLPGLSHATGRLHSDLVLALAVAVGGWALAWLAATALPLRAVVGVSAAAHGALLLAPPLPLTDVFNYGLYGRMAALHGLNPYRDLPVTAVRDPLYPLANWHHLRSPYGPLFTLGTQALTAFGAHGWLWAWKAIVVVGSFGVVLLVVSIAGRLGASRQRAAAALGLSPLLLIFEVGGLHNDVPAVGCLLAAVWCLLRGRDRRAPAWIDPAAGALAIAAAGIKPSFGVVAALVVLGARNRPRAAAGAGAALVALAAIVLVAYGGALPDLTAQGRIVTPLSVPNLLGLALGHGGADHAVRSAAQAAVLVVALAATAVVALRRERALSAIGAVLLCALLGLAWVMPWYLVWALPFLAIGRPPRLAAIAVLATCWLTLGSLPQLPGVLHAVGYYPTHYATGLQNHQAFERLVR